jgi:hypothetical protein
LYSTAEINAIGIDPWAWFREGVDDFNSKRREVLHQGAYETMDESMFAY